MSSVTSMIYMFSGVTLSTANYSSILMGWSQLTLKNGVKFHADRSKYGYGTSAAARQSIIDNFGWTITDGGMVDYFNIAARVNLANTGTITGTGNYAFDASVTLTATANEHATFVNWTEGGKVVSTDAEYTFTATDDRKLVANFKAYTVSTSVSPDNSGSITGAGEYYHGSSVILTATATEGYIFLNWTEDGAEVSTDARYTFTAERDRTLVANFVLGYTISATANLENSCSIEGAGDYVADVLVTLTATANTGYTFVNWTEDGTEVSTNSTYTFTAESDRSLVANFSLNRYTISASVSPENSGTVSGAGEYDHGTSVTLTATANEGYIFLNWTEDDAEVSTNSTYTFAATDDRTLVAHFALGYTISATANPENTGTVEGAGDYVANALVTLIATANTGYTFVNWTEDGAEVSTEASYTFTAESDRSLVANFSLNSYTISARVEPASSGTITGAGDYNHSTSVTLTATPNEYYTFVNWTEDGEEVSTEATYTFTAESDRTLVANFSLISYTISANVEPESSGTITGAGDYDHGTLVNLTATANTGYTFVNWTEDGIEVSTSATYTLTAESDRTLVANFSLNSYTISASAAPENSGTVSGTGEYDHGTSVTLTATANEHYTFVNWTEDGENVSTEATYTFTAERARSLVANFRLNSYTISASVSPENSGTVSGAGDYDHGTLVNLTATANTGYTFVNWTEDGTEVSTNATYTFTAESDRSLVANFSLNSYTISASAAPENSGVISGTGDYDYGTSVTLTATANTGYSFVNWTEDGAEVSTEATYTFTAESDRSLVANFSLNSYTISASAAPENSGTISGTGDYDYSTSVTLTATANTGYTFVNWTEDGTEVSTEATYTFTAESDRTLVANFKVATGIENGTLGNAEVYPNPFGESISLKNHEGVSQVIITNLIGQRLMDVQLNGASRISTAHLQKGVYLVVLVANDGTRVVKRMVKN
ncbi:PKD-like domain protein [anaerobic digester metagenome]